MSEGEIKPVKPDVPFTTVLWSPEAWKGVKLSRYKLEKLLGDGGMGRVFLARDVILQRDVALKTIPESFKEARKSGQLEQFLREAQSVARLEHPNVVRVYDVVHQEGVVAIAMEYVSGGTFKDLITEDDDELLPIPEVCRMVAEAADGLAYAHENGMIHRDIKPANLMLTDKKECKVVDFGTTHIADEEELEMFKGKIIGTPIFTSPEVIKGEAPKPESDIYSLSIVLWWALTGTSPYSAKTRKDMYIKHLTEKPPNILKLRPQIPAALRDLIRHGMEKEAEDRLGDMEKFAEKLREISDSLIQQDHSDIAKISAALGDTGSSAPARRRQFGKTKIMKKAGRGKISGKKTIGKKAIGKKAKASATKKKLMSTAATRVMNKKDLRPRMSAVKKKKYTTLIIAIGAGVLVIIGIILVIVFASRPPEKKEKKRV